MTLTRKLLLSYLALVGVTALTLVVAADRLLRARLSSEAAVELEREARFLGAAARGRSGAELDSTVRSLGRATDRRLTIVDANGVVIVDSDFRRDEVASLENHADRPEVRAAHAGRTGMDLRRSASTGRWELKVAVPIGNGAVVRVSSPLPQVDALVADAQGAVLLGAVIAAGVAALLALGFAGDVARPLVRLRDAAQAIAGGESPALDLRGRDEVGDLARALRTVDERLSARLRELEHERSEMAALIASMVEGVVACDALGAVTTLNPAARLLLGLGSDDRPASVRELFRQRAAREAVDATLAGGATAGLEVEHENRTILLSGQALPGGGAVFALHDVSDLKRLETVRRDFVANVSHELKTPLTVVRGYAETLLKDDPPSDIRRGFLDTMLTHSRRMQRLIDDLLDLSRIESGAWRPEPAAIPLSAAVADAWRSLRDRPGAGTLAFTTQVDPNSAALQVDPGALQQILLNVLDNAVRHTPAGGRIAVRARRDGPDVRLDISDTGAGIPAEHLPRIFERFYRADPARDRERGGTGLGLAIVKHLVEAHGGHVEAESTVGTGTTIRMRLPAA
ncbi:MAG: ATP-binding protein [Gemmatimonadales bacterium]|nr:ATP-binding protein [Gemmatimonadales bacterium]